MSELEDAITAARWACAPTRDLSEREWNDNIARLERLVRLKALEHLHSDGCKQGRNEHTVTCKWCRAYLETEAEIAEAVK